MESTTTATAKPTKGSSEAALVAPNKPWELVSASKAPRLAKQAFGVDVKAKSSLYPRLVTEKMTTVMVKSMRSAPAKQVKHKPVVRQKVSANKVARHVLRAVNGARAKGKLLLHKRSVMAKTTIVTARSTMARLV